MSEPDTVRLRYLVDAVATATPAQRIVMLYDRLLVDIDRTLAEFDAGVTASASVHLRHAQAIIGELWGSLDVSAWSGAADLVSLYSFLMREFIDVERFSDPDRLGVCRRIVELLRGSWAEAAEKVAPQQTTAASTATSSSRGAAAATRAAFAPTAHCGVPAGSWIS
jgi:flagellar protein FliS